MVPGGRALQRTPFAARQQVEIALGDLALWDQARERHPLVKWWWGQRQTDKGREAVCYVCQEVLASWDGKWPMTATAKQSVMQHRARHMEELQEKEEGPSVSQR